MTQLVKEYEPDDTMAEMEMENSLNKLTLGKKKDPNDINDKLLAIECRYQIDLEESSSTSNQRSSVFECHCNYSNDLQIQRGKSHVCNAAGGDAHSMAHCWKQVST